MNLRKLFLILFLLAFVGQIEAKNALSEIAQISGGSATQNQEPIVSTEIEDVKRKISDLLLIDKAEITFDGQFLFEINK